MYRTMASTMVPDVADRPDVFPTERLQANGMAEPGLRARLRRIDNRRNALTVVMVWLWVASSSVAPCGSTSGGAT